MILKFSSHQKYKQLCLCGTGHIDWFAIDRDRLIGAFTQTEDIAATTSDTHFTTRNSCYEVLMIKLD